MPQSKHRATAPLTIPMAKISLERLFEDEESPLLGFAYGFVRRREIAEDLVQEAFLRLHQHWGEVENPRPWLYQATRNLCLTWIRDHKRETPMDENDLQNTADPDSAIPDKALIQLETRGTLRSLLAEFDDVDRELIRLKYTEGMRYTQIAEHTGLSVSNVGYKLHHILHDLAASLRQSGIAQS